MNELSYFEAWHHWLNGENVSNYYLWSFQIIWWGRIGKLVSFISALAVIAELIGPDRLRNFGESLHGRFTREQAIRMIKAGFYASLLILRALKASIKGDAVEEKRLFDEFFKTKVGCTSVILGFSLSV
ncbi:MAG: hypothetical protein WCF57_09080 [Pyrinomonadaceae bacterium]